MRGGGLPASVFISGTDIQSAITSNIDTRMSAPSPLRERANNASRIAACAVAPVEMSTTEMPTRVISSGLPVIEQRPHSAWISRS